MRSSRYRWHLPPAATGVPSDSFSHLHNRPLHLFISNARLTYWLLNNAASNNRADWCEGSAGIDFKKVAAAYWHLSACSVHTETGLSSSGSL
ncbi:hypothetical protein NQZ68_001410 [Dissostichus eleginoides]|nr:hypothetical protein NQZ68_001410 [Dissostichus eleginoides]